VSGVFRFASAVGTLHLSGNATLGDLDPDGRPSIYIFNNAGVTVGEAFETVASNNVYLNSVDFRNPWDQTLIELCPDCLSPGIFHTPQPVYNGVEAAFGDPNSVPYATPTITIDPVLYYNEALAECQAQGHTPAACQSGAAGSYHHIVSDTTISGGQSGITLEGVIYIEAGVDVIFKNDVTINGTIFHEGTSRDPATNKYNAGSISLPAGTNFHINSEAAPSWGGNAFARGIAIAGAATLDWKNTASLANPADPAAPGIKGFVMAYDMSTVASDGLIRGGVIGVKCRWFESPGSLGPTGTVSGPPWQYRVEGTLNLGGSANIQLDALEYVPPGFSGFDTVLDGPIVGDMGDGAGGGGGGVITPTIHAWLSR